MTIFDSLDTLLIVAMLVVAVMIAIGLYRVFAGPTVFDRLVAVALVSVNGVVVLVLLGFAFERASLFLDIALGFALLAFLLPIALGRYFEDRDDGTSQDGLPSPRSRPRPEGIVPHGLVSERARREQERAASVHPPAATDAVSESATDTGHGADTHPNADTHPGRDTHPDAATHDVAPDEEGRR